jgi:hypothetical protein
MRTSKWRVERLPVRKLKPIDERREEQLEVFLSTLSEQQRARAVRVLGLNR